MILYNVTVSLEENIEPVWLQWMKQDHIPKVMETGLFVDRKIFKLLSHEQEGAITYAIQYFADTIEQINIYQTKHAEALQAEHDEKFKDKFVAFRTMLEHVD
ncbi:DUF4286 family protein [Reichenbachiella carrageenanivorans]|uniref:DUF4286 family protein n=1 Tax=Reichenbachiella carrageenanivorans TaxID=2979869 RepID=A0ABY6D8R3_9BACT|nr:DUF4286 family protein [Reichenbachiella carrageenanivorans]UXX80270.1 DUF4286 family protein [Reichenbachiella carrageenanivorans]